MGGRLERRPAARRRRASLPSRATGGGQRAGGGVYHGDLWDLTNGAYLMAWTAGAQREEGACVQIGGRWATTGTPLASPPGALPDRQGRVRVQSAVVSSCLGPSQPPVKAERNGVGAGGGEGTASLTTVWRGNKDAVGGGAPASEGRTGSIGLGPGES